MIGWPLWRWWAVAWRFGEESQQPMCPQLAHIRRWTQLPPIRRQSSQPAMSAGGSRNSTVSRCWQAATYSLYGTRLPGKLGQTHTASEGYGQAMRRAARATRWRSVIDPIVLLSWTRMAV